MKLKEVMFLPMCVCVSVCNEGNTRLFEWIFMKFAANDQDEAIFLK